MVGSSIKMTAEWSLTHHNAIQTSSGKNTVLMNQNAQTTLVDCLNGTQTKLTTIPSSNCRKIIVENLLPKFLILRPKSSRTEVKSELMIHNPGITVIFKLKIKFVLKMIK